METKELRAFLEKDVIHLREGMPIDEQKPKDFYRGFDTGWGCIVQNLDVKRSINDSVLVDAILADESEQKSTELFALLGPAGNGKTVALKRIAWEASVTYGNLVFFLRESGTIRVNVLEEIYNLTGKRSFIFVDRMILKRADIHQALTACQSRKIPVTIIGAERANEWSGFSHQVTSFLRQEFSVHYLSETEVNELLDLLTRHQALGLLADRSRQQQVDAFVKRAQRQLLVALHEATLGLPFETILKDEYENIPSPEARQLYLSICALNQFGAPVRTGLISRATGIDFPQFRERLFEPLQDVVFVEEDRYSRDNYYRARHQHVAEVVFSQVLGEQNEKFDLLVSLIQVINPEYASDAETFATIIRGRNVASMFSAVELGRLLYDTALTVSSNKSHVLHQRAIFEMRHPGGTLEHAEHFATLAAEKSSQANNLSINHTRADIARRQADKTDDPIKKEVLRRSARSRLSVASNDEYYLHTKALLAIDVLRDLLTKGKEQPTKAHERLIVEATKDAETAIQRGLQGAARLTRDVNCRSNSPRIARSGSTCGNSSRESLQAKSKARLVGRSAFAKIFQGRER